MSEIVDKPLPREFEMGIALSLILSVITCGLYNVYWNYQQFRAMNHLLSREEYKFWPWAFLALITCGLYHIYTEYRMGADLHLYMKQRGLEEVNPNMAVIGLLLSCLGLWIVADAIYQHELNRLCA
ncbi:MAG: DUF4234 domain-containing protein [Elusimicrobia bacterium]|nr:DUF4234 domain-containing protein [Elusimicrobiota bacterium]